MYRLYCETRHKEQADTIASSTVYCELFRTEFNLGFHNPSKDRCDFCVSFENLSLDEKDKQKQLDIAGHERFGHMTRVYYKYAIAAIIVFDLSRPATFDSVLKWLEDVNSKVMLANEDPVPVMLLANKCDIDDISVEVEKMNTFCKEKNFIGWYQTSAKTGLNIDDCMHFLVEYILSLPTGAKKPRERMSSSLGIADDLDINNSLNEKIDSKDMGRHRGGGGGEGERNGSYVTRTSQHRLQGSNCEESAGEGTDKEESVSQEDTSNQNSSNRRSSNRNSSNRISSTQISSYRNSSNTVEWWMLET
ncbi:ras-related protein rab-32b [Plakobranchus ocellatus]|uniref:Ras-related protein rab-32b n=1 Tax=Plakobranchus ocellatus TaxID=259542 RepID=A0AAV4A2B7_9GAST|nr:ras-related protein rab-32b [Plakobranchus ocellatus]